MSLAGLRLQSIVVGAAGLVSMVTPDLALLVLGVQFAVRIDGLLGLLVEEFEGLDEVSNHCAG